MTGGVIHLEPLEFLEFCGSENKLHVTLDPNNTLVEMDELNNVAVIEGVTVTADNITSRDYCSGECCISSCSSVLGSMHNLYSSS